MAKVKASPLIEKLLYAHDHELLDDPLGRAMQRVISAGIAGGDAFVNDELTSRVTKHQTAQLFAGPYRQHKLHRGKVVLGMDQQKRPIRVPVQCLCAHCITVGGSGSGKTVKSRWLALQVAAYVMGLWLFDFRKREYACLVPWFFQLGLETIVVSARQMRLNPLQVPEHVNPFNWASRVADMLVHVFRLPPRATKLLQITILDLFDRFGVLVGKKTYPTLFDLRETIAHDKTANPQARQAVVDNLDPVLVSLRSVLCYRCGWSSNDLAKHKIVFELDGVGEVEKDLILNALILPVFTSRIASGVSNQTMDLWICCDEAARLVSASSTTTGINDLLGLIRGLGIGMYLAVQSTDIAPAILSNTANKFIGRCGSSADYDTISAAMGLTLDQRRSLNQTLVPGMFVGQIGEGSWRHPFLFEVPYVDFSKPPRPRHPMQGTGQVLPNSKSGNTNSAGPTDPGRGLDKLLALPVEKAVEFENWKPKGGSVGTVNINPAPHVQPTLNDTQLRYLKAVIDHPARPSSEYAKLAGVGTHQAIALRKQLIDDGYLRIHRVNTGKRGRASIVLEPLPLAFAALGLEKGSPS